MSQNDGHMGEWFYKLPVDAEPTIKRLKPAFEEKPQQDLLDIFVVRDITHSPAFTIDEDCAINELVSLMEEHKLSCIFVTDKEARPIGVITRGDLAMKVLTKTKKPSAVTARDVMTSPIVTTDADVSIREVAERMSELRIGKLGVVYKGNLVGWISNDDVVALLPRMRKIMQEMVTMSFVRL